jgi:hypothetical protein
VAVIGDSTVKTERSKQRTQTVIAIGHRNQSMARNCYDNRLSGPSLLPSPPSFAARHGADSSA